MAQFKQFNQFINEAEQNPDFFPANTTLHDILPSLQPLGDQMDKLESKDPEWNKAIAAIQKKFNELEGLVARFDTKLGIFVK
jgi:hypothetical protein